MIKIRQWLQDLLGFSRSEANGTLVLIVLLILFAILPRLYLNGLAPSGTIPPDPEILNLWSAELKAATLRPEKIGNTEQTSVTPRELFTFDPNQVSKTQLITLGFSDRSATNLIRYRESGGGFRVKSDLNKIYGVSEAYLTEIWKFIDLPETIATPPAEKEPITGKATSGSSDLKLEINTVSAEELQQIRGIGPVLSERIVKFRDRLGGFYASEQLGEVYGLSPEVLSTLKEAIFIRNEVKKINLNTDSASHLYSHPYIDYKLAGTIVNYRTQHGKFEYVEDLRAIKIISDSLYQKIYPYLSLNP